MDKTYNSNDEIALVMKRLFATDDGKDVLSVLKRRFSDPSIVPNATVDGVALAHFTFMRVGEQNVVKYIESLISKEIGKENDGRYTDE